MQYMYYIRTVNKETISETGAINVTTPGLRRYFTEVNKMPITDPIGMCSDMVKLVKVWKKVHRCNQAKHGTKVSAIFNSISPSIKAKTY